MLLLIVVVTVMAAGGALGTTRSSDAEAECQNDARLLMALSYTQVSDAVYLEQAAALRCDQPPPGLQVAREQSSQLLRNHFVLLPYILASDRVMSSIASDAQDVLECASLLAVSSAARSVPPGSCLCCEQCSNQLLHQLRVESKLFISCSNECHRLNLSANSSARFPVSVAAASLGDRGHKILSLCTSQSWPETSLLYVDVLGFFAALCIPVMVHSPSPSLQYAAAALGYTVARFIAPGLASSWLFAEYVEIHMGIYTGWLFLLSYPVMSLVGPIVIFGVVALRVAMLSNVLRESWMLPVVTSSTSLGSAVYLFRGGAVLHGGFHFLFLVPPIMFLLGKRLSILFAFGPTPSRIKRTGLLLVSSYFIVLGGCMHMFALVLASPVFFFLSFATGEEKDEQEEMVEDSVQLEIPTDNSWASFSERLLARRLPMVGANVGIRDAIGRAESREPFRLIVLSGKRGTGKSRLLRESFLTHRVYMGGCEDALSECPPLTPFRVALGSLVGAGRFTPASSQLGVLKSIEELADVSGGLGMLLGVASGAEDARDSPSDGSATTLARAIVAALQSAVAKNARRRVVLALEDMESSDPASHEVLNALVGIVSVDPAQFCFTVVICYRDERDSLPQWLKVCRDIVGDRFERHMCNAFSQEDVVHLLALLGFAPSFVRTCAHPLFLQSVGNPLFISMLLASCAQEDLLERTDDGLWAFAPGCSLAQLELPDDLNDVIKKQIDSLSVPERSLLSVASCIGLVFDVRLLVHALDGAVLLDVVKDLVHLESKYGIVWDVTQDDFLFSFTTGALVSALCAPEGSQLSKVINQRLSEGCLEMQRQGINSPQLIYQLAEFSSRAGPSYTDVAFEATLEAAKTGEKMCALDSACAYASKALTLGARSSKMSEDVKRDLSVLLARSSLMINPYASWTITLAALEPYDDERAEIAVLRCLALAYGGKPEASSLALQLLEREELSELQYANCAWAASFAIYRTDTSRKASKQAVSIIEDVLVEDDDEITSNAMAEVIAKLLNVQSMIVNQRLDDPQRAIDILERSLSIIDRFENPLGRAISFGLMGSCHEKLGQVEQAIHCFKRNDEISIRLGNTFGLLLNPPRIATLLLNLEHYEEALIQVSIGIKRSVKYDDQKYEAKNLCLYLKTCACSGVDSPDRERVDRLEQLIEEGVEAPDAKDAQVRKFL